MVDCDRKFLLLNMHNTVPIIDCLMFIINGTLSYSSLCSCVLSVYSGYDHLWPIYLPVSVLVLLDLGLMDGHFKNSFGESNFVVFEHHLAHE